jgi:hypothetical protein
VAYILLCGSNSAISGLPAAVSVYANIQARIMCVEALYTPFVAVEPVAGGGSIRCANLSRAYAVRTQFNTMSIVLVDIMSRGGAFVAVVFCVLVI